MGGYTEEVEPPSVRPSEDRRNIFVILAAFLLVLLLLPPQHEYPIIDDWIYANSVQTFLERHLFVMPPMSQANLVGLTLWGALFSALFKFSFTTLTYSTLVLVPPCLVAFYATARRLDIPPSGALLGTLLLFFNPLFLHLQYSFMTDVPFLTLVLLSCYCYLRGVQDSSEFWLLAGGLFAGLSFLIRQLGLLVPAAFFGYLLLVGLMSKERRFRQQAAVILLPAVILVGWYLWSRGIPVNIATSEAARHRSFFLFKESWARVILLRSASLLPLTALFVPVAIQLPRRLMWLVPLMLALLVAMMYAPVVPGETWLNATEPTFVFVLGSFAVELPRQAFNFGLAGNILRVDGIDFFEYKQQSLWPDEAWWALWVVEVVLAAILLSALAKALFVWLLGIVKRRHVPPVGALYMTGLLTFAVTVALAGDVYDRYILAFLPFVILFVVRGSITWSDASRIRSWAALSLLALFSLLLKADMIDHDNARWQAGDWFSQRVGQVHSGFDWNNWRGVNPNYQITDFHIPDFRLERSFPYYSRLGGFSTRYLFAESAPGTPPLK